MRFLANAIQLAAASPHAAKAAANYAAMSPLPPTRTAQWTTWDNRAAIKEGFKGSSVVFACVRRYMQTLAAIPWYASEWEGPKNGGTGGEWVPIPEHPAQQRLEEPSPGVSGGAYFERITSHLLLGGNHITHMAGVGESKRGRPPSELIPMDIDAYRPVPGTTEFISHYEPQGAHRALDKLYPHEVIHLQLTDPDNPYWGMAPLEAAGRAVDTDTSAAKWNRNSMDNRAVPDAVVTYRDSLTPTQHKQALDMTRQEWQGPENARTPIVLGNAATVTKMSMTPVEMDFTASRRFNREEICSAFFTPPVVAGFFDDATLANAEASWKAYYRSGVIPLLDVIRSGFRPTFVKLYQKPGQRLSLFYDTSQVEYLQQDFAAKWKTAGEMWRAGVPMQEINRRQELDLMEYPGWDQSYIPGSTVLASEVNGGAEDDEGVL
jgi:HK97 family phage portal protein